ALSCYFLYRSVFAWWQAFFVITNSRVILINWQQKRQLTSIPITKADDMSLILTLPGRIIGYGAFLLKMSDPRGHARKISRLPYPEQLYLEMIGLIFQALACPYSRHEHPGTRPGLQAGSPIYAADLRRDHHRISWFRSRRRRK